MDPALRLQPGQEQLTPTQEAEAERFADEYIHRQLSTEPVDEQETEAWLRQAYEVAGLAPPQHIQWLDGPLQLVVALAPRNVKASVRASVLVSGGRGVGDRAWAKVRVSDRDRVMDRVMDRYTISVGRGVVDRILANVTESVRGSVEESVGRGVGDCVWASVGRSSVDHLLSSVEASVCAYYWASKLAYCHFFDVYLAPNEVHALAQFNERVSGYWLGKEVAWIVRRPTVLARDVEGRLHSATGQCITYRDGWGFSAWHGVVVPEQVILAPETLTREDFLNAENAEVRRVIQERMGQRFVPELSGVVLDSSPRGTLYEVKLPDDDPDRVARYVQVEDASTERQYFLRVPPTTQTAAEAVAWTFQVGVVDYHPAQET